MNKDNTTINLQTYHAQQLIKATGKIDYTFTNDYMFHAVLQSNETVLRGLLGALLRRKQNEILQIEIKNPIVLGEALDDKTFIMDLLILLNNHTSIDLEMQVNREDDWTDRSLSYLCRNYDKLFRGQAYEQVHPAMHIGILDFDLFPDELEFYASYMMLNIKNHKIFNDKFILNVLSLNQIELATDTDRRWQLDTWARLFKAKTWEEIHMIAKQNKAFASAAQTLYQYNEDERIRWQCRQREDYDRHERIQIKKIQDLTEQVSQQKTALAEKDSALAEKDQRIAELETILKEKQ